MMAHTWWGIMENHVAIWVISGSVGCNLQQKRCLYAKGSEMLFYNHKRFVCMNKLGSINESLKLTPEELEHYDMK